MTIHIEITRSFTKGKMNLRVGDLAESKNTYEQDKEKILSIISAEIDRELNNPPVNNC